MDRIVNYSMKMYRQEHWERCVITAEIWQKNVHGCFSLKSCLETKAAWKI